MSFYQETRPECIIESFHSPENQKKYDRFNVDRYCDHCKTVFEAKGCYNPFCLCQETRYSLSHEDIERRNKRREMNDLKREPIFEKVCKNGEMGICEWWQNFRANEKTKNLIRINSPYKRSLGKNITWISLWKCNFVVLDEL